MMKTMTIRSIAGYCYESGLWKMLCDLSRQMLDEQGKGLSIPMPDNVSVEGEDFRLNDAVQQPATEFYPPEGNKQPNEAAAV